MSFFCLVGKTFDKDKDKEMTAEEKVIIEEFKRQFDDVEKKKAPSEIKTVFVNTDKITTNGLFVMYLISFPLKHCLTSSSL